MASLIVRAWNLLHAGRGRIDWAGVPAVAAYLGIDDPVLLINGLESIQRYIPPQNRTTLH
ncbi:hypothetical protein WAE61_18345 [Comamonadaceae bacterium PP-2]